MPWKTLFEFVPCIPRKQQTYWLTYKPSISNFERYVKAQWYTRTCMCPKCNTTLIPILYGYSSKKYLDMHKEGLIFLVSKTYHTKSDPVSYCSQCQESFNIKLN